MMQQVDMAAVERDACEAWTSSPKLRYDFVDNAAAHLALCRAEALGKVKVHRSAGIVTYTKPDNTEQRFTLDAVHFSTGSLVELSGPARGRVRGYAAAFGGAANRRGMRILRGAFADAVNRSVPMLQGHRHDRLIGRFDVLREDDFGLLVEGGVNVNVPAGREAVELLSAGDLSAMSIGFQAVPGGVKQLPDGVLEFSRVDLFEISLVAVPAEPRARITGVGA